MCLNNLMLAKQINAAYRRKQILIKSGEEEIMAQNFVEYIKNLWNSNAKSGENSSNYDSERKKLQEYIAGQGAEEVVTNKPELPDTPEYEKINYTGLTDEEIGKRAESDLSGYRNQNVNAIESEIENLQKQYEADKNTALTSGEKNKASIEQTYENAKEDTSNDSLKRGLARSSIAVNKQAALSDAKANALVNSAVVLQEKLSELDGQINSLSSKREKALNDFNIAYASKLTTTINDLKEERENKLTEALKYNNTITEKQYNNAADKIIKEASLYGTELSNKEKENKLKGGKDIDYASIYSQMRSMLSGMNSIDARGAVIKDPIFKENLTDYYYYKLYDEFTR